MDRFLRAAIEEARTGLVEGGIPIQGQKTRYSSRPG